MESSLRVHCRGSHEEGPLLLSPVVGSSVPGFPVGGNKWGVYFGGSPIGIRYGVRDPCVDPLKWDPCRGFPVGGPL